MLLLCRVSKTVYCLFSLFVLAVCFIFWTPFPVLAAQNSAEDFTQDTAPNTEFRDFYTIAEWVRKIKNRMLYQQFHQALTLCLKAQKQYPEQPIFRDYEASIREYLQVMLHNYTGNTEENNAEVSELQLETIVEQQPKQLTLKQRLIAMAKQDPLLSIYGGAGFYSSADKNLEEPVVNLFTQAVLRLYFSTSLGISFAYYDPHWNFQLQNKAESALYSFALLGSLRFRNKFNLFSSRSYLSFAVDIGMGLYDIFPSLEDYQAKFVLLLGFSVSNKPFYHFWGIEALAGLQLDLGVWLYLSMQANALSIVQTGNWEAILWQSFGILRFGLAYRFSISEYYQQDQVFLAQHQLAFLLGLEWRTRFQ